MCSTDNKKVKKLILINLKNINIVSIGYFQDVNVEFTRECTGLVNALKVII